MVAEILILPQARLDLDEAAEFYEKQEPGLGGEVYAFLVAQIMELAVTAGIHPEKGGVYRSVVLGRFPYYSVYYQLEREAVTVVAVIDNRRDPAFNKSRLSTRI